MARSSIARRVGLARALSKLGYCSRSSAAELIRAGRVKLNGTVRRDPETPTQLETDRLQVDGHPVVCRRMAYLALNKPRGVVTSASDEKGRKTVYDLLPRNSPWLGPVGRLDKASEGLLLLTNDSEWASRVLAPETHLDKIYHVQLDSVASPALIAALHNGVRQADGELLRVKSAQILRTGSKNSWIEVVLDEGRNRHIRRLLSELGIGVLRLVRVAIGPLPLGSLPKGASRLLTPAEKRMLDEAMKDALRDRGGVRAERTTDGG